MSSAEHKYSNALIKETSPYLLQHAHNPVNWFAWNQETLEKAQQENKLILISIGYSACHWCHVMEKECFEDEKVAQLMNDYFICIKVDREERPDIDQVYMLAVQLMTGRGGWPLNCFALPDQRPIYGGTYFPKQQWMDILLNLADTYTNDKEKTADYAKRLTEGVKLSELVTVKQEKRFTMDTVHQTYKNWEKRVDLTEGGPDKAPKFPLPNNYQFLLHYYYHSKNKKVLEHVELTLKKMAYGGIYDQLGGGFSRYSVDSFWKVPHFEKMLYDNAQLVSLYCEAFRATQKPLYKQVVYETLEFIERELTSQEGLFYSALDADSEGVEGKYYVWKKDELKYHLETYFDLFADYFNINERGYWEHDCYILLRQEEELAIAEKYKMSVSQLKKIISELKQQLLKIREERVRPALDTKIIASWNALMAKAYIDAGSTFDNEQFINCSKLNLLRMIKFSPHHDSYPHILKPGESWIINKENNVNPSFLEDNAFVMEAFLLQYEFTFMEIYLAMSFFIMERCIAEYYDEKTGMFFYTSSADSPLIARKMELSDNVIPASNSSIAKSLFRLGHLRGNQDYIDMSKRMLSNVMDEMVNYGEGYSNWALLMLWFTRPFYEVVIVGDDAVEKRKKFANHFLPNMLFAGTCDESPKPLFKNKYKENETLIYICENNTCFKPVNTVEEALLQIK